MPATHSQLIHRLLNRFSGLERGNVEPLFSDLATERRLGSVVHEDLRRSLLDPLRRSSIPELVDTDHVEADLL